MGENPPASGNPITKGHSTLYLFKINGLSQRKAKGIYQLDSLGLHPYSTKTEITAICSGGFKEDL
jgi:hypothetical protein